MKRPLSMTGYGRGEAIGETRSWTAEVRSVNHRYCDIKVKLPRKYLGLEDRIKKEVIKSYGRGHVDVMINPGTETAGTVALQVNMDLAKEYLHCLGQIKSEFCLPDEPTLAMIKEYKEVIIAQEEEEDLDAIWPLVQKALKQALDNSLKMRQKEGAAMKKDLTKRLKTFTSTLKKIEKSIPQLVAQKKEKLEERLATLLEGVDLDPIRLTQEVAVMTDKADVTEELVRLKSHIDQFSQFLKSKEQVGRRLDFLLQEFIREINTMASKINDATIAHQTVDLKNEVEKLREQVQNLE